MQKKLFNVLLSLLQLWVEVFLLWMTVKRSENKTKIVIKWTTKKLQFVRKRNCLELKSMLYSLCLTSVKRFMWPAEEMARIWFKLCLPAYLTHSCEKFKLQWTILPIFRNKHIILERVLEFIKVWTR